MTHLTLYIIGNDNKPTCSLVVAPCMVNKAVQRRCRSVGSAGSLIHGKPKKLNGMQKLSTIQAAKSETSAAELSLVMRVFGTDL